MGEGTEGLFYGRWGWMDLSYLEVRCDGAAILGIGGALDATTLGTRVSDRYGAGIDGQVAVYLHTHAAMGVVLVVLVSAEGTGGIYSDAGGGVLFTDNHAAIGLDATRTIARRLNHEGTARYGDEAVGLDGFAVLVGDFDIQCTALDEELSVEFLAGVGCDVVVQCHHFGLYAVALCGGGDVHGTTVLLVVLAHVYAVAHSGEDVDGAGGLLQLQVFLRLDGMREITADIKRTTALHFEVSLAVEASLLGALCIVGKGVLRAVLQDETYTLATLDVDGCTLLTGER